MNVSLILALSLSGLLLDHGPGTSGGGLAVQSGDVIPKGAAALSLRFDFTRFESLSRDEIVAMALKVDDDHAHVDTVDWTLLQTVDLSYGVTDDFQVSYAFGYYRASDLQEGHVHADMSTGFHEFGSISGPTDHWLTAKVRVHRSPTGRFALFGGVKFPFGDDDEVGEDGTSNRPLEPSVQPGSGAFDVQAGAAWSMWLSETVSLDASLRAVYPFEGENYQIGPRVETGAAVAWRLTETGQDFPQPALFAELIVRWQGRHEEDGDEIENTGGTTLFLSPGIRVGITESFSVFLAPQFPVVQDLNDEQQETEFRVTSGVSLAL